MTMSDKFMILGCQRSGTTLLGMILQAHNNLEIIEENNFWFHRQYALTYQLDLKKVWEYKSPGGKSVVYKAPRDSHRVEEIINTIPNVRIIWIVRNIFQVIASMMTLDTGDGTPWASAFAYKEIIKYLYTEKESYELSDEYKRVVSLQNPRERSVALAALCWVVKRYSELKAIERFPDLIHRVSYGRLVNSPGDMIEGVLQFLGVEWDPSVLNHGKHISGKRPGGSIINRPIDTCSLDKWKSILTEQEINLIGQILEKQNMEQDVD